MINKLYNQKFFCLFKHFLKDLSEVIHICVFLVKLAPLPNPQVKHVSFVYSNYVTFFSICQSY